MLGKLLECRLVFDGVLILNVILQDIVYEGIDIRLPSRFLQQFGKSASFLYALSIKS